MKKILTTIMAFILLLFCGTTPQKVYAEPIDDNLTAMNVNLENFEDYTFLDIHSKTLLLLSNQRVTKFEDETLNFDDTNTVTGIYQPKFALILNDEIAVLDSLDRVQVYNTNFEYKNTYQYVEGETKYNLGNIVDVSKDYAGNLFLIDSSNNKVLMLSKNCENIVELEVDETYIFDDNAKISVNPNGNLIAIYNNEKITLYDINLHQKVKEIETFANQILFDYQSNLFVLQGSDIKKYSADAYEFESQKNLSITPKNITIDAETGRFYVLTDDDVYKYFESDFSADASSEVAPIDITSSEILSSQVRFAKTKNLTKLYATCVSFSSSDEILGDNLVMILKTDIEANNQMWFCLSVIDGKEKQGYIEKSNLTLLDEENQNASYSTICKNVSVYAYPTTSSSVVKTIKNESVTLKILGGCYNFKSTNNSTFCAVEFDDGVGYIQSEFLQKADLFEGLVIDVEPTANNSTQFVAYILTSISLFVAVIFVCSIIAKKKNYN